MTFNCILNSEDEFFIGNYEKVIDFTRDDSFSFTFWNEKNMFPTWYDSKALDLLYISLSVFAADRLSLRDDAIDGWSRNLEINIPVLNIECWNKNKTRLEEMLSFLSGDSYKFHFRERTYTEKEKKNKETHEKIEKEKINEYDRVCMFSGGMDSFVGAIDLLESDEVRTLFVSHYGGGKGTREFQDELKEKFIKHYGVDNKDFHQFYAKAVSGIEDTTRTRSFMFFSHAIVLASALGKKVDLIIPENGLISLNIPNTLSRLGTSSTRTTHPHYLEMFQDLLDNLGLDVHLKNPYQFKTKGEMLLECLNQEFVKENLCHTMSCAHPDNGRMLTEKEAKHCGYCLPCVIRQAAIKKAGISDESKYRDNTFKIVQVAKMNLNSYRLGIEKFNPKYAFMTIQQSGSIKENIDQYTQLYCRGMQEVIDYLEDIG